MASGSFGRLLRSVGQPSICIVRSCRCCTAEAAIETGSLPSCRARAYAVSDGEITREEGAGVGGEGVRWRCRWSEGVGVGGREQV